jgi:predicted protein tyrosine phosphatase
MRILFVCSEDRLRSPTAAAVFSRYDGVEAISAGTNKDCEQPVSGDLIEWSDVILVMERSHKTKIQRKFRDLLKDKKVGVLDIPDHFEYMDPLLIRILETRVPRYVRITSF